MTEHDTPSTAPATDEDVRAAWTAWSDPGDDRWTPERFDRWLAAHNAELRSEVLAQVREGLEALPDADVTKYFNGYMREGYGEAVLGALAVVDRLEGNTK